MTLKQTVTYAIDHSRTLQTARQELAISELEVRNSWAQFFPSLDFSATHGIKDADPSLGGTAPWSSQLTLGLTENLYDNGATITKYYVAKTKRDRQKIAYLKSRDQLCLSVAKEFFRYSLATQLYKVKIKQNELLKKQYKSMNNQYQQGNKTRRDVLRFEAQLRRSDIELTNTKNNMRRSELELIKLVNAPMAPDQEFLPESAETKPLTDTLTTKLDFKKHYEAQILELQKQENKFATDLVRREYWPRVDLSAGVSYDDANYINRPSDLSASDTISWNVLVTFKYNLWDWGIRGRNFDTAELRQQIQDSTLETRWLEIQTEIENLLLDIQGLQANFKLSDELLTLEQKNFTSLSEDYRRGTLSYLDLVLALADLSSAQVGYYSALFALREAQLSLIYHEGQIYEFLVQK